MLIFFFFFYCNKKVKKEDSFEPFSRQHENFKKNEVQPL